MLSARTVIFCFGPKTVPPFLYLFGYKFSSMISARFPKYLDISFPVFHALLAVGLQPTGQCRRVANPATAMQGNVWLSTYFIFYGSQFLGMKLLLGHLKLRASDYIATAPPNPLQSAYWLFPSVIF